MSGPAPKPREQRRRNNPPARSEWVDLTPLEAPVLPPYKSSWRVWVIAREPKTGLEYQVRRGVSRSMWAAWRADPVTSQYGPADIALCCYLAEAFHTLSDASRFAAMDKLGLTPKGKRDLRWRTPAEVKTIAEQPAPVRRLRLTEKDDAAA